jgi:hypothetical protein
MGTQKPAELHAGESSGCNANHGVRLASQQHRGSYDPGVAGEVSLPEPVIEHDDLLAEWREIFFLGEEPSERRAYAKQAEEVMRDHVSVGLLGLRARAYVVRDVAVRGHALEATRVIAQERVRHVPEVRSGDRLPAGVHRVAVQSVQSLR